MIFLALALSTPAYSETSGESAPDWPELSNSLNEIEEGLQMTDEPLHSIESSQAEREQALNEKDNILSQREQRQKERERALSQKELEQKEIENRLQQRERGLSERELGLQERKRLYDGMQADLNAANKKVKAARIWGIIIGIITALVGGAGGYWIGSR